jgi:hypothetical protein
MSTLNNIARTIEITLQALPKQLNHQQKELLTIEQAPIKTLYQVQFSCQNISTNIHHFQLLAPLFFVDQFRYSIVTA